MVMKNVPGQLNTTEPNKLMVMDSVSNWLAPLSQATPYFSSLSENFPPLTIFCQNNNVHKTSALKKCPSKNLQKNSFQKTNASISNLDLAEV